MFELRDEPRAQLYRDRGYWTDACLHDHVTAHAAASPERTALVDGSHTISYAELLRLTDIAASHLLRLGVGRGEVVSVQLPNWWEFAVLMLAIERIGAVMNPLTTILRERELRQMLSLSKSKVLVVPSSWRGFDHAAMAVDLQREIPSLQQVIVLRSEGSSGPLFESSGEIAEDGRLAALQSRGDEVCELAFSSGTTGEPKGVLHSHNSALATVASTIRRQRIEPGTSFHVATPVGHNAGYFYGVRIALQSGGTAVLQDTWDAGEMVELIRRRGIGFTMGTTAFLIDFLEAARGKEESLRSLRVFTCGGAPIPPSVAEECERRFPGVLCPVFGMTEMGHATSTGPDSPRVKAVSTDGSAQPEMEMKVVDAEGRPLPPGREGVLKFRGPFLFRGYLQGAALTDPSFDDDGFFDTGDLAVADPEGYIRITGRVKDLIIRGGENVPVREIEDILADHPKVVAVAVVGTPDERLGERAIACIVPRGGEELDMQQMRAFLDARRVARQFWPEGLEIFDAFPMTPAGKVQKVELRRLVGERRA